MRERRNGREKREGKHNLVSFKIQANSVHTRFTGWSCTVPFSTIVACSLA